MLLNFSDQTRTCVFNMIWPMAAPFSFNLQLFLKFSSFCELSSNLMISNNLHQRLQYLWLPRPAHWRLQLKDAINYVGQWTLEFGVIQERYASMAICSLEWLCSFLKFFQVIELLESMQLSCRDQFGTKVEFSASYTKTHSLLFKNLPIDGKTITKNGNWVSPVCQFVSLKGTIQADVIKSWGRTKTNYRQGPHSKTLIFQNRTQLRQQHVTVLWWS